MRSIGVGFAALRTVVFREATAAQQLLQLRILSTANESTHSEPSRLPWLFAGAICAATTAGLVSSNSIALSEAPPASTGMLYTKEQVAAHKTPASRVWVTYKDGVYDITDFIAIHPGGAEKIMLAAGGSVEPFWAMYQQHNKAEIRDMLAQYRIGTLEGSQQQEPVKDPYSNEPLRHPVLIARSDKPYNGETPSSLLATTIITPTDLFYVRNHLPVPKVDQEKYVLRIEGEGLRSVELTLDDLRKNFKKHSVIATLQCAGNRRSEMKEVKEVKGLNWEAGSIGTAVWSGARLRDVLQYAGLQDGDEDVAHIHLEGLDVDVTGTPYAASIPISKAMDPCGDVLLAYEMNGEAVPEDHGAPVRAVVPGIVGARNVKWLGRVVASQHESSSHWQQHDYKAFTPSVDWDTVDWSSAPAIQELPVQAAICTPAPNTAVTPDEEGLVTVRGYAYSGGGREVIRVDVSSDGGKTWQAANLEKAPHQKPGRAWSWALWEAQVAVPQAAGSRVALVCKATDSSYNTMPDTVEAIWNLRGVVTNSWHRVPVVVEA